MASEQTVPQGKPIITRRIGEKFRVRIEILDEKYTDHWEGEWVEWANYELDRERGLDVARSTAQSAEYYRILSTKL